MGPLFVRHKHTFCVTFLHGIYFGQRELGIEGEYDLYVQNLKSKYYSVCLQTEHIISNH